MLKDFIKYRDAEETLIKEYENRLPDEVINIWREYGFDYFFEDLYDGELDKQFFNIKQYNEAVKEYGKLDYDECFGYVPLLGLGGKETVKNLKKVKVREHIELICEMVGGV